VSTFAGDGFNWDAVRQMTGKDIYVVANWQATEDNAANSGVQGLFSWYAWPSENNRPINKMMDIAADVKYIEVTEEKDKIYMAPVSPWCESFALVVVDAS
jgi:glucan endo-1,3-alpha-glucosidase